MTLNTITHDSVTILEMRERLDGQDTQKLEQTVESLLSEGAKSLLFDFEDLDYINSSGLRILVMAYQRLHPSGGRVTVCCARDYIQEVFEISGYDKLFGMYETREAALKSL
ncbi:STAS domain-containing protein [Oleidesulfovibrio sp.]|uniref:STAS domain-containing protein n=1 Tax=Oleidesulfovibrio sp. TaxID=2909707 RepID=UPI003A881B96